MATLQRNDPARPRAILEACRVDWSPAALGVNRAPVREALLGLPRFVHAQGLPYSIIERADLGPLAVDTLLTEVLGPPSPETTD